MYEERKIIKKLYILQLKADNSNKKSSQGVILRSFKKE